MDIDQKLTQWVHDALKRQNFKEIKVKLTGLSGKGDGYVSDINFAKLNVVTFDGETKELEVVIKYGKLDDDARGSMPLFRQACEREVYVFDKVIPQLQKFVDFKKLNSFCEFIPKCYGTLLNDNEEVVILENLKIQNYDLHDKYQPFDITHLKLTLETYGRWHALSFAYQDQHPEEARSIFENLQDVILFLLKPTENHLAYVQEVLYTILQEKNEVELIERIKKQIPDFNKAIEELFAMEDTKKVFLHGDSWNSNFMFKYDSDKSKPEAVKFLDFQLANFRPPIFDLAYHIYCVASEKELEHFDELLKIYHASLSKTLKALGSDADSIYPFEDLVQQWKQFSSLGIILGTMVLTIILSAKEDTIDLQDINDSSQLLRTAKKILSTNGDILTSRVIAFTKHYLDFLER